MMTSAVRKAKISSPSISESGLSSRLLAPLERLPSTLSEPTTEKLRLDHNWVWVAEHNGVVVGFLIACECHGLALVLRIRMEREAPNYALNTLVRRFAGDVLDRGCFGWMSFFEMQSDIDKRLLLLARSMNGAIMGRPMVAVCAKLPPRRML